MPRRVIHSSSASSRADDPSSQTVPETPPSTEDEVPPSGASSTGPRRVLKIMTDGEMSSIVDDGKISGILTSIFRRVENPGGFSWKLTPKDIKDKYWDEFQKFYTWPEELDAMVFKLWLSKTRAKYSAYINELKQKMDSGRGKPDYLNQETWEALGAYWQTPAVKEKSSQCSQNRLADVDGPGSGPSKHKGGSKSASRRLDEMSRTEGLPRLALSYENFRSFHLKEDGTGLTPKDNKIEARVQELAAEKGEGADRNEIYKSVVAVEMKLIKKGRFYGNGENTESFCTDATSGCGASSQIASQHFVQTQMETLQQQLREEREKREQLEAQVATTQRMVQELLASRVNPTGNGEDSFGDM